MPPIPTRPAVDPDPTAPAAPDVVSETTPPAADGARRGGRKRRRRERETPDYVAFTHRAIRALGRRAAAGDLEALAALDELQKGFIEEVMHAAVVGLKSDDGGAFSNLDIGLALGYAPATARQTAYKRFPVSGARKPGAQPAHRR